MPTSSMKVHITEARFFVVFLITELICLKIIDIIHSVEMSQNGISVLSFLVCYFYGDERFCLQYLYTNTLFLLGFLYNNFINLF